MAELSTKPRPGRLPEPAAPNELVDRYIEVYGRGYRSIEDFALFGGTALANTGRAVVALMRVPYPPYYDTSFILKQFKTANHRQAHREQVELEAASLHHAGEAFQRNNNISRSPRVYTLRPEQDFVAMERIHARGLRDSPQEQWAKERMIKFVRHMAAVRLAILTQVENQLGVPRHSAHGGRVGPYCSFVWWEEDRFALWGRITRGPFPNRHEMILASLRRERLAFRGKKQTGQPIHPRSHFHTYDEILEYLDTAIRNVSRVPRPTSLEFFSLNHNDLEGGYNVMVRGSRVAALIDWEVGAYDPLHICISDLAHPTDFDPRVWWEHAGPNGENFHVLPYRLERDPMQWQLQYSTDLGAQQKPFPDWGLIENIGGPLGEEDFCCDNYPEDISSDDDESIVDAAEMHCHSDVDAEEEWVFPTIPELQDLTSRESGESGESSDCMDSDWYYEPVYALMKEFIHHQHGAGLGPDGEWGRLPEEYSRPLAEWEDPLYMRVAQAQFVARPNQLIGEHRVGVAVAQGATDPASAPKVPAPTQNPQPKMRTTGRRPRRVPTLIHGVYDDAVVGAEVPLESPIAGSSSAYLARNRPRRVRPKSPPTAIRKPGRNLVPIPRSALQRAREPRKAKQWAEVDHPPVETPPPDDYILVKGVRDSILAKVLEKLRAVSDSEAGVL